MGDYDYLADCSEQKELIREKFFRDNNYNFKFFESDEITKIAKSVNPNAKDKVRGWYFQVPCDKCGELFWARYISKELSHTGKEHRDQKHCEKCSKRNRKRDAIPALNFIDLDFAGHQCAICGKPYIKNTKDKTYFHGHHIIEYENKILPPEITNILNYYPINLILLCSECHKNVHTVYRQIDYNDYFIQCLYNLNKYFFLISLYEDEKYSNYIETCRNYITERINKITIGE